MEISKSLRDDKGFLTGELSRLRNKPKTCKQIESFLEEVGSLLTAENATIEDLIEEIKVSFKNESVAIEPFEKLFRPKMIQRHDVGMINKLAKNLLKSHQEPSPAKNSA